MKDETVVEYLKYTFSDAEVLELSKTLAKHNQDLSEIEAQKKRITADFAAKIQAEQEQIGMMSRKVCSGYEFRNIDCKQQYHVPRPGLKTIVRLDTGELVKEMPMTESELQEVLPFMDGAPKAKRESRA